MEETVVFTYKIPSPVPEKAIWPYSLRSIPLMPSVTAAADSYLSGLRPASVLAGLQPLSNRIQISTIILVAILSIIFTSANYHYPNSHFRPEKSSLSSAYYSE